METEGFRSDTWRKNLGYESAEQILSLLPIFYLTPLSQQMVSISTAADRYLGRRIYLHQEYLKMTEQAEGSEFAEPSPNHRRHPQHNRPVERLWSVMKALGIADLSKLPPPRVVGAVTYDEIDGQWVNGAYLKFLYQFLRFTRSADLTSRLRAPGASVLEIGGGFGGMADLTIHNLPNVKYTIIDLNTSLALSVYYLFKNHPDRVFAIDFENAPIEAADNADIEFYLAGSIDRVSGKQFDLAINSESLLEMTVSQIAEYFELIQNRTKTSYFYNYNRDWRKEGDVEHRFENLPYDKKWADVFNETCPLRSTMLYAPIRERLTRRAI